MTVPSILSAMGCALAMVCVPALAHEPDSVMITAPAIAQHAAGRDPDDGFPLMEITARSTVNARDLDLSSYSGAKALEARIKDAAVRDCKEIDNRYPFALFESDDASCVHSAVNAAMVRVDNALLNGELRAKAS